MKALAVVDKNLGLGYKNGLLFRLPSDLAHFRRHTLGQSVIMGQKTLESMPKGRALEGRNTLVLNSDAPTGRLYELNGAYFCHSFNSLADLHEYIKEHSEALGELVVSGGASIYRLLLDECDELVMTEVDAAAENADVYFPEYKDRFLLVSEEGPFFDGELRYYIRSYRKP